MKRPQPIWDIVSSMKPKNLYDNIASHRFEEGIYKGVADSSRNEAAIGIDF